jgi:hypothetical protein
MHEIEKDKISKKSDSNHKNRDKKRKKKQFSGF